MTDQVEIYQDGLLIGTLPRLKRPPQEIEQFMIEDQRHGADPIATYRTGDFRVEWRVTADGWIRKAVLIADPKMGLGDLENIRGFRPA